MSRGPRFGVYLLPDAAARAALCSTSDMVADAFGARAAARLPVHVTVKGFFATAVDESTLVSAFNELPEPGFGAVRVRDVVAYGLETVAIQVGRDPRSDTIDNELMAWHRAVIDRLLPLVHPQCEFTSSEWHGDRWDPHITIASHDVAPRDVSRLVDFVRERIDLRTLGFDRATLIRATSSNWRRWWSDVDIETIAERSIVNIS